MRLPHEVDKATVYLLILLLELTWTLLILVTYLPTADLLKEQFIPHLSYTITKKTHLHKYIFSIENTSLSANYFIKPSLNFEK